MRTRTIPLVAVIVFLVISTPCLGIKADKFHAYAYMSDTDKINLVIQWFNQAIQSKSLDGLANCISPAYTDNAETAKTISACANRLFAGSDKYKSKKAGYKREVKSAFPAASISLSPPLTLSIVDNGAVSKHALSLGGKRLIGKEVEVRYEKWMGGYGVINLPELTDAILALAEGDSITAAPEQEVPAIPMPDTRMEKSAEIPNMLIHKTFIQVGNRVLPVFNKVVANSNLGVNLFGGASDILETITFDPGLGDGWGMVCSDPNWDRIILFANRGYSNSPPIIERHVHATPLLATPPSITFRYPTGVSLLTDQDLYVCDVCNDRVGVYHLVDTVLEDQFAIGGLFDGRALNRPVDVDAGHIPLYAAIESGCVFDNWVAICDQGNNRIVITSRQGGFERRLGSYGSGSFQLRQPTSIAFARNPSTGWQTHDLYVVDDGNQRVVEFYCPSTIGVYDHFRTCADTIFDVDAHLTSVDVDGFGQVYVLDSYHGMVYKFDPYLNFIGKWGGLGTGTDKLNYPQRLAVTRGWHMENHPPCPNNTLFPTKMGEMLITEQYNDVTGIKRFLLGNDLTMAASYYQLRDCNLDTLAGDDIHVSWNQFDYGNIRVVCILNTADTIGDYVGARIPGQQELDFDIPYTAPVAWTYRAHIVLTSAYGSTVFGDTTVYGEYDRGSCNFPPSIDTLPYIIGNDSCFMPGIDNYFCAVHAIDLDDTPEELWYYWVTDPVHIGKFIQPDSGDLPNPNYPPYHWYRDSVKTHKNQVELCTFAYPKGETEDAAKDTARSIFSVKVEDPHHGWMYRKCFMPFGQGTHTCDPDPVSDTGCPMLYYYSDSQWRFVNNLLAESEVSGKMGTYITEIFPVFDIMTDQTARIHFRVTEEVDEVSSFQSIRGVLVTYPDSLPLIVTNGDQLFGLTDSDIVPSIAYTSAGDTITDLIDKKDGKYFRDVAQGALFVVYDFGTPKAGYPKPLTDGPGGPSLPPPSKAFDKSTTANNPQPSGYYEVFAEDEDRNWISVARAYPRLVKTEQFFELSDHIVGGKLILRIDYCDSIGLDYLPYHLYQPITTTTRPLVMVSAVHSNGTNVASSLTNNHGADVVLRRGEYIDLIFQGSGATAGYKQAVLLASRGKYQPATNFAYEPKSIVFEQNFPNPFNPTTSFRYYLPEAREVTLEVYNVLGQKVVILVDGLQAVGDHVVIWDSRDGHGDPVASGIYFTRFTAGDFTAARKIEVLK
jgi:hypothetical protein